MTKLRKTADMTIGIASVALLILFASGCNRPPKNQGPQYGASPLSQNVQTYDFAVHPLHNPSKMNKAYQPLIDYLNRFARDIRFNLEASRDYGNFEAKFRVGRPAFLLPNPWQTLEAMKAGYTVIAMAGEPRDFKGIFLVRRDSSIRVPADLKGKAVSYPSHTALAACIMPQYFLHSHGVNVNTEIDNRYVGSPGIINHECISWKDSGRSDLAHTLARLSEGASHRGCRNEAGVGDSFPCQ